MFNVNNTYIRISGCIINVRLNQDGKNTDYVYAIGTSQEGGKFGRVAVYMISDREVEIYLDWNGVGIAFDTVTNLKMNVNNYIIVNNYKCDIIEVSYSSGQKTASFIFESTFDVYSKVFKFGSNSLGIICDEGTITFGINDSILANTIIDSLDFGLSFLPNTYIIDRND